MSCSLFLLMSIIGNLVFIILLLLAMERLEQMEKYIKRREQ